MMPWQLGARKLTRDGDENNNNNDDDDNDNNTDVVIRYIWKHQKYPPIDGAFLTAYLEAQMLLH